MLFSSGKDSPADPVDPIVMTSPTDESSGANEDTADAPVEDVTSPSVEEESAVETAVLQQDDLIEDAVLQAARIIAQAKAEAKSTRADAKRRADSMCANASEQAEKIIDHACEEAGEIRKKALSDAKGFVSQAEEQGKKALVDAWEHARQIRSEATATATSLVQTAQAEVQRLREAQKNVGFRMYARNHAEIMAKFTSMNTVMAGLNEIMHSAEEMLVRTHTKTVFDQLHGLYSLMADHLDSLRRRPDYAENTDLQIWCGNLEEFMYMIVEYLGEHGVRAIVTRAGMPFEGKFHDAGDNLTFDPAAAKIDKSLRAGFLWDEVVLVKEKVTVC